jgi:glutamyl-tRNA synthetase
MSVRVRFAPSPTGHLHIGGARTALYNWLYARQQGGTFILRIEDTDTDRSTQEYTEAILEGMRWLGMDWDEGPHHQMERVAIYEEHRDRLFEKGLAYRCNCSSERLDGVRKQAMTEGRKPTYDRKCRDNPPPESENCCVRFKAPLDGSTTVRDLVRGEITFENKELDDMVIFRSNGTPTYNFVVVVDDVTMQITHIIRGDDHLNNTPRQLLLYDAFEYPVPTFAHLSMILGADTKRLSKRHGASSVTAYRDAGYLPEGLLNYLARLGWSHGDQEIFTLDEMVKHFAFEHVHKAAPIFDQDKLDWVNAEHLKKFSDDALAGLVEPFLGSLGLAMPDPAFAARAIASERERGKTLAELAEISAFYFRDAVVWDEKAVTQWLGDEGKAMLADVQAALQDLESWDEASIKPALEAVVAQREVKFLKIAQPIRVAMTGTTVSPGIYEVLAILGKERSLKRLTAALNKT